MKCCDNNCKNIEEFFDNHFLDTTCWTNPDEGTTKALISWAKGMNK